MILDRLYTAIKVIYKNNFVLASRCLTKNISRAFLNIPGPKESYGDIPMCIIELNFLKA